MDEKVVKDSQGLVKDLVNDCISRKATLDALEKSKEIYFDRQVIIGAMKDIVRNLPSAQLKSYREGYQAGFNEGYQAGFKDAQSERERGKWIEDDDGWDGVIWRCSECDAVFTLIDGTPKENEYYFCPYCGADMREVDDERPD